MKRKLLLVVPLFILLFGCEFDDYDKPEPTEVYNSNKKVLFIGIDGLRSDAVTPNITPFIWSLIEDGQTAYHLEGLNESKTWSSSNWSSLLTGVHWQKHNAQDNSFLGSRLEEWPNLIYRLEATYTNIETASIVHWKPINDIIVRNCVDIAITGNDNAIKNNAVEVLQTNEEIDFMFLHFDDPDAAGHASGFTPNNALYTGAITATDERISEVIQALESRSTYDNEEWLIVITTDHGGQGTRHGNLGGNANVRNVPIIFSGASVQQAGILETRPNSVDVPVTILEYFNLPIEESLDGRVLSIF